MKGVHLGIAPVLKNKDQACFGDIGTLGIFTTAQDRNAVAKWVKFMMRFLQRPLHAFGAVGSTLIAIGSILLLYLAVDKLVLGHPIGGRPLLLLGALLTLIGVQLLATGVLGELLTRVYHEPQGRRQYVLRDPE